MCKASSMVEQGTHNPLVTGSNPVPCTKWGRGGIGIRSGLKIRREIMWVRIPPSLPKCQCVGIGIQGGLKNRCRKA